MEDLGDCDKVVIGEGVPTAPTVEGDADAFDLGVGVVEDLTDAKGPEFTAKAFKS